MSTCGARFWAINCWAYKLEWTTIRLIKSSEKKNLKSNSLNPTMLNCTPELPENSGTCVILTGCLRTWELRQGQSLGCLHRGSSESLEDDRSKVFLILASRLCFRYQKGVCLLDGIQSVGHIYQVLQHVWGKQYWQLLSLKMMPYGSHTIKLCLPPTGTKLKGAWSLHSLDQQWSQILDPW